MKKTFDEVFIDNTKLGTKVPTSEYSDAGKYIIVDQGQSQIAGYTDKEQGVFKDVPVIIFGDHTRVIKYVDRPFFLGADGTKVLKSKFKNANYKYLFYALKNVRIQNTGYNRHFKWLKMISINYPSLLIQSNIAVVLDTLAYIIECKQRELELYDELIKARFVELFGDPYFNPYKWKKLKIADAVTVEPQNGLYKPQTDYIIDGTGIPILRIDCFYNGEVADWGMLKRLRCTEKDIKRYQLNDDDIVINRVNSIEYLGKCAHITGMKEKTVFESNMMRMHFDKSRFNPIYITKLLCTQYIHDQIIKHAKKAVNQASINQHDVMDFDIYLPPLNMQQEYANFVRQIAKSKLQVYQYMVANWLRV